MQTFKLLIIISEEDSHGDFHLLVKCMLNWELFYKEFYNIC